MHTLGQKRDLGSAVDLDLFVMYLPWSSASEGVYALAAATGAHCCEFANGLVRGWQFPS